MTTNQKNPSNEQSDEELMLLYQKGEERAFEILYWRHQHGIFNFICHFIGGGNQAEELLQDVFLKVVKSSTLPTEGSSNGATYRAVLSTGAIDSNNLLCIANL